MLIKLIKHEFKSTGRALGLLYIALIFTSLLLRIYSIISDTVGNRSIVDSLTLMLMLLTYIAVIIAVSVLTLFIIITRFYKSMFCDEGYLTNMLPVKPYQLVLSKFIVSLALNVATALCIVLSLAIITSSKVGHAFSNVFDLLGDNFYHAFSSSTFFSTGIIILVVTAICSSSLILHAYASMAIGQMFNQYKIAASITAFIIFSIILRLASFLLSAFAGMLGNGTSSFIYYLHFALIQTDATSAISTLMLSGFLIAFAQSVFFFAVTEHFLHHHLNLN